MRVSIGNQVYVFLCCIAGGIIIAFIYDIFRVRRKSIKASNIIVYFEDFIYWIIVAFILFAVLYYSNEGEIRGYLILGIVLGIILYAVLLSNIVMKVFLFFVRIIYKVVVTVFSVVLLPVKIIYKIIRVPVESVFKYIKKISLKIKKLSKINMGRLKGFRKILKIIWKKI